MHPQLVAIVDEFERAQERLHRLADRTDDDAWAARPHADAWSAAECVAHLNLTSRAYVPLVRGALAERRASSGTAPARYRRDPVGWLISTMSGPMPRIAHRRFGRVRTAAAFVPDGDLPRATLLADFDALQAEQIALVRQADGAPLERIRVTSPFDARVRYNLYACLVTLPAHQHRHLEQAEEAVAAALP